MGMVFSMAIFRHKYSGMDTLDENLPYDKFITIEGQGLYYYPGDPGGYEEDEVTAYAYHTHYPYEGSNISWNNVSCTLTRRTSYGSPDYLCVVSLYGLNSNHNEELVGEKVYTTIDSTRTTDLVNFNLNKSSGNANLVVNSTTPSTPGYIDVELPMRYIDNYESITMTVLGATPLTPATPDANDTVLSFATPSPWYNGSPVYLTVNEYNGGSFVTESVNFSSTTTLLLGYDGLDKYDALRLGFSVTTVSTPYTVQFDDITYTYRIG